MKYLFYKAYDRIRRKSVLFLFIIIVSLNILPCVAYSGSDDKNDIVLLISSYNPDTKRTSDFIREFSEEINKEHFPCIVLLEDMNCRGLSDREEWEATLKKILSHYDYSKIKAVVFLGQEAWSTFIFSDLNLGNIPFWAAFVSENGVNLRNNDDVSINMINLSNKKGKSGGYINRYDVNENIKLIRSLYPLTENIAFISDNTYGGASLCALMKKEMKKYKDLGLILIDSRYMSLSEAKQTIVDLPKNTTILLGTWRVDMAERYYDYTAIDSLMSGNPTVPVFSISGRSIGDVALGGYVPNYMTDAATIAQQIIKYSEGDTTAIKYLFEKNIFKFDDKIIRKMGIADYQLPPNCVIVNTLDSKIKLYEAYITTALTIAIGLFVLLVVMYIFFHHNFKLKKQLQKNEKELIEAKERAEESDRLKSAFLANVSHEIRTPLNAIVGFSHMLAEDDEISDEEKKEFGEIILNNSDLLLSLINDILDISRLETGKTNLTFTNENIETICTSVFSTTQHLFKSTINYQFKPSEPGFMLYTDTQRLSQILINLVTNANKFTESGSITLAYDVDAENKRVLFSVTDTGCGIPEDKREKVFMRFEKLNEIKQGTGLGLAICKQLALMFGGDIWVDESYNEGARFVFSHPINP